MVRSASRYAEGTIVFLMPLHVISCSHEFNSVDRVGRVRLSPERIEAVLDALWSAQICAVVLSTCHRTEVYWWGDAELDAWFARDVFGDSDLRYQRFDADLAVRHLFAVAAGLRSLRFGEPEILGQVRRAWQLARSTHALPSPFDRIFRHAIESARYIRQAFGATTEPSLGTLVQAELAAYAVDMAPRQATLLVVGSGMLARSVLTAVREADANGMHVAVTSRTDMRARAVAEEFQTAMLPWAHRDAAMAEADAVVFAVQVTQPLVREALHMPASPRARPALWIDLGVPAAVAPSAASSSVRLRTLDDLTMVNVDEGGAELNSLSSSVRHARATAALQQELARCARASQRQELGGRLSAIESQALAVAEANANAPIDEVVRRVTRLVYRQLHRG